MSAAEILVYPTNDTFVGRTQASPPDHGQQCPGEAATGRECSVPSPHLLTVSASACPAKSQPGTVSVTETSRSSSASIRPRRRSGWCHPGATMGPCKASYGRTRNRTDRQSSVPYPGMPYNIVLTISTSSLTLRLGSIICIASRLSLYVGLPRAS